MQLKNCILVIGALSVAADQSSVDVTSKDAIIAAAKSAMPWLKLYYSSPNQDGAWDQQLLQWHESGIFWDLFYQYGSYSGDNMYSDWVDSQMLLSTVGGDFLNGNSSIQGISGRWNDDIGWWGFGVMTAAEHFGPDALVAPSVPGNGQPTYFAAAKQTYLEMLDQWDTTTCGGGIYWSRDRNSKIANQVYYKSTITNVQNMELGARLFAATKDRKYLDMNDKIYAWLLSSKLITSDFQVWDGLDSRDCTIEQNPFPYHAGEVIAALAISYGATQNQTYLDYAHKHWAAIKSNFINPSGVLYDPICDQKPGSCSKSPDGMMWALYKGLANLYLTTPDTTIKADIAKALRTSATANFKGCGLDWNCMRVMNPIPKQYTLPNGTNHRDQMETVSLLNAVVLVNGATKAVNAPQGTSSERGGNSSVTITKKSVGEKIASGAVAACVAAVALIA